MNKLICVALIACLSCAHAFVENGLLTNMSAAPTQRKGPVKWVRRLFSKKTGVDFLSPMAIEKAQTAKRNKFEKVKLEKCGSKAWTEVHEFSAAIRSGEYTWEELDIDDADIRLKWAGLFHRRKRDPGTFMMRLKIPNGIMNSEQMRMVAGVANRYDPRIGVVDITTRMNIQIRGVTLEDATDIFKEVEATGLTTLQSGMDNVRNMVGSPIAGIDPLEQIDTRQLCTDMQAFITNNNKGCAEWTNLPRKFNIAISGSRDDFAHTMINDLGLQPCENADGVMGFNVVVGGLFSIKRVDESVPLDMWVRPEDAVTLSKAVLRVFRDYGPRNDRQGSRIMYLVDELGVEKFREMVEAEMKTWDKKAAPERAATPPSDKFEKRNILGVHPQKQEGLSWVGINVPAGRMTVDDCLLAADVADAFCSKEIRLTVDQHIIFPNVDSTKVDEMLKMPFFEKFPVDQGDIVSQLVSCTGAEFCSFGLVETKHKGISLARKLDAALDFPEGTKAPRIHWTGCPNSCGQAQIGDIGLMGAPARVNKKAVEGVNIFLGGKIGGEHGLGEIVQKGVPAEEDLLFPVLRDICIEHFGAVKKRS